MHFSTGHTPRAVSTSGTEYPLCVIAVPFTRRVSYFHLNVILPLFLIVSVGFSAWAVDRENVDGRLEVRSFEICDTTGLPDRQTRRRVAAASCARVVRAGVWRCGGSRRVR